MKKCDSMLVSPHVSATSNHHASLREEEGGGYAHVMHPKCLKGRKRTCMQARQIESNGETAWEIARLEIDLACGGSC
jgi:hypothetical protein